MCSSHLIEHFVEPEYHVREVARVLAPGGSAFFITPNKPADFENPYHVYLFDPDDLRAMLGRHFAVGRAVGPRRHPAGEGRLREARAMAGKLLKLDPLGLRHKLPRGGYVWMHATGRRVAYRFTDTEQGGGQSGITDDEFFLTEDIDPSTLVLFAECSDPIRLTPPPSRVCCGPCATVPSHHERDGGRGQSRRRRRRRTSTSGSTASRAVASSAQAWVSLELVHPVEVDDVAVAGLLGDDVAAASPRAPTHTSRSRT